MTIKTADPVMRGHLEKGIDTLSQQFEGIFSRETVERYVDESFVQLKGARIEDFVPLFVNRFAKARLTALAQVSGEIAKETPEVLFVCVHNAGRSQMAAALTDMKSGGRVHVRSAGSAPGEKLNPAVVEVISELGGDISKEFPKPITDEVVEAADAVITMGCGDSCPIYPGKRYEDWEIEDPEGKDIETVRAIRDDLANRIEVLLAEIAPPRQQG